MRGVLRAWKRDFSRAVSKTLRYLDRAALKDVKETVACKERATLCIVLALKTWEDQLGAHNINKGLWHQRATGWGKTLPNDNGRNSHHSPVRW